MDEVAMERVRARTRQARQVSCGARRGLHGRRRCRCHCTLASFPPTNGIFIAVRVAECASQVIKYAVLDSSRA